jgi:hypothetical protein
MLSFGTGVAYKKIILFQYQDLKNDSDDLS